MFELKFYEPLWIVYYKDVDWEINSLTTPLQNKDVLMKKLLTDKFVEIEWVTISLFSFWKWEEPKEDVWQLFYSQSREVRTFFKKKFGKEMFNEINKLGYDRLKNQIRKYLDPEWFDKRYEAEFVWK